MRNQIKTELQIYSVETDCDCLQILEKPDRVKANESAVLRLSYLSEKVVSAQVKVQVRYWVEGRMEEAVLFYTAKVMDCGKNIEAPQGSDSTAINEPDYFQMTATEAIHRADCVWIDVRSPDRFQKVRIPKSLNLPLYAVKTNSILRECPLVLIGNGDFDGPLLTEAMVLEKAGYREVKVLKGGIRAWEQVEGPLERVQAINLALLSPESVPMIERESGWKIIEVSEDASPNIISKNSEGALKILLIGTSAQAAQRVIESWPVKTKAVLFELDGGLPALDRVRQGALIAENSVSVKGLKQIGRVGGGKKGCGSCP